MASPSLPPFSRRRLLPFPLPVGGPHPSCSAMFWTTTEPTVNALPMAELQQQPQEPAPWNWSPGLLCMQQQQQQEHHQQQGGGDGGCSSADDASPFAAAAAAREPCFADYPPGVLSALESVPFSLHAAELDLGQWQVYLSHFIPGMQVVDSFQDLTLDQREQAIKFASDMALAQAGAASAPEPCLQQQQRPDLPRALPVDGCGRWNYGFPGEEDRDQLVTTALLPTCFREDGEQAALAELGTSQTCEEFHRRLSCSRQYFLCEAGQGRDGGGPPAFLAQEIEHQPFLGSSSDCVHEANSCGSDNLIGESAPNLSANWRGLGVPVLHVPELSIVELPDESSSVANDADNLDSTMHSRFKQLPQLDPIDSTLPCGSWIPQCRASDSESSGSMQEAGKNFDPATWTARPPSLMIANTLPPLSTIVVNLEEEEAVAFKRQRVACYTMESLSEAVNLHLEKEALAAGALMATPLVNALARPILYGDAEKTREFSLANRTAFTQDRARPPFQSTHLEQRGPADAKPCYRKIPTTSVEPQSVAARQRRKKISERVRVLEQLIPGGHKMDTASMLDEAIEYVKFLQLQVNILESLGSITDQAHSPAISSSSNNGYGLDLGRETSFSAFEGGPGHGLRSSTLLSVPARPSGGCPLILSEVLQQQLFKHKLCIVSLRQCALPSSSS